MKHAADYVDLANNLHVEVSSIYYALLHWERQMDQYHQGNMLKLAKAIEPDISWLKVAESINKRIIKIIHKSLESNDQLNRFIVSAANKESSSAVQALFTHLPTTCRCQGNAEHMANECLPQ